MKRSYIDGFKKEVKEMALKINNNINKVCKDLKEFKTYLTKDNVMLSFAKNTTVTFIDGETDPIKIVRNYFSTSMILSLANRFVTQNITYLDNDEYVKIIIYFEDIK